MKNVKLILGTMTFGESVFESDAEKFVRTFLDAGNDELDTAYVYNEGKCELILGEVLSKVGKERVRVSTKVNPRISGRLDGEAAHKQLNESLMRLGLDSVDIFYLHFPDSDTPVLSVLQMCAELYDQGKFRELGLSNFPAWMVADVWHQCKANGWVLPTVYEGLYNPLSRHAERELDRALDEYEIRFYAYNPLAGGLLTDKYFDNTVKPGRFTNRPNYQNRYWRSSYFEAIDEIRKVCRTYGMGITEAAYRFLAHHSMLDPERGDGIIIGASKFEHLTQNISYADQGELPEVVVRVMNDAWEICKADAPEYFTFYKAMGLK